MKPGIYKSVSFPEYLGWPLMSQSVLKEGRDSMLHLKCAVDGERELKITDDMLLGSALHCAFLEPIKFDEQVICWQGGRRYGKEWKAFCEDNAGKTILTEGYYKHCDAMVTRLREHPELRQWHDRIELVEVSGVAEIEGVAFKGRVDALTDDPLWDLKKISKTDDRTVIRTINDFGYHIQAYCYCRIFGRERFCLALIEGLPPYDIRVVELSADWIKIGKLEATTLLQRYKHCLKHGTWPGRCEGMDVVEPPEWLLNQMFPGADITLDGKSVFQK